MLKFVALNGLSCLFASFDENTMDTAHENACGMCPKLLLGCTCETLPVLSSQSTTACMWCMVWLYVGEKRRQEWPHLQGNMHHYLRRVSLCMLTISRANCPCNSILASAVERDGTKVHAVYPER